ncbi:MAG: histidine phosphatase family protein [Acidimicrobiales bacterium]|nr:histidine phosphatase family protein [Acidimicrobiales bacterium]
MQLFLIRHAHAGSRSDWTGDDALRPLSARGEGQARAIAAQLADAGIDLLWSSPYVRCRQTLEPLAEKLGLEVLDSEPFAEGGAGPVALDAALEAAAAGRRLAVCSHGDVLPAVATAAERRGAELVGGASLKKAARFDCTVADDQLARLVVVGPPDGDT